MKKVLVVLVALVTMVAFASLVMAQAPKEMKATGTITGYEAGKIIKVQVKDKVMSFDITGDTRIKGEVKEGAKVTVKYQKDGDKMVATSIAVPAAKKAKEKK